ncbi:MAG TPA: extracellular solute-binding protein [Vicinamibacterales bacterium]|nr:extracellular solute-binding protein [Vicinamibacterales bacterium]
MRRPGPPAFTSCRARAIFAASVLAAAIGLSTGLRAEDLVTPVRVGRSDAPIVLSVWAQQDYSHLAARPAIATVFTDVFADWARAHPDVQLRVSVMPALELHKAKLQLAAAAGRLPDVASIDSFWLPLLANEVQPLDEFWPADDRRDFLPFTIETLSDPAGRVLGMWHETDCRVLFYRKDLVPVPPATWDALLDTASRVARDHHVSGYLYNAGRWEATVFDHLAMFWAQGGELVDRDGRPIFGEGRNRRAMLRLLTFLHDTIQRGASPRAVLGHNDYQQLTGAAIAGDAAMFLGGNWQLKDLQTGLSPAEFARWDIAPIPTADPGTQATGTGGWIWVVFARDPARRKAAVEFIRDVESAPHAARISEATGHLPVRQSVYRDVPMFGRDVWYRRFGEMLVHGHARPTVPIYPVISQQLQLAIGAVVSGERTPEEALDAAWSVVTAEYSRRWSARTAAMRTAADPIAWLPMIAAALFPIAVLVRTRRSVAGIGSWLLPALALVTVILIYPMCDLLRVSLTDAGIAGRRYSYTGSSYRALITDPAFYGMIVVTVLFVAASVALQLTIGFAIAWLIDAARRRRGRGTLAARVAVVSAWVMPGVLAGVLWKILLIENRSGIVNYYLSLVHLGPAPLISSPTLALASVVVANVWRGCAFSMILLYAGMQRVPRELHEAADLEGASSWQRLRWVLVPQLAPVIALNLVLITIASFNTFDLIIPLTGGGPARRTEVISLFMYRLGFFDLEAGRAAAVAVVMLAVNLLLAAVAGRLLARTAGQPGHA